MQYEITYSQSALKSLCKLDRVVAQRMVLAIGHRREVYRLQRPAALVHDRRPIVPDKPRPHPMG